MTAKTSVFIATSLDGFIARADGNIDWLNRANAAVPDGEDCGYGNFIETVDAIVMGRNTFEQVLTFDEWAYGDKRVVVPDALKITVSVSSESPALLLERLIKEGSQHIYIDVGQTIQGFLRAGSIDELTITIVPILLGAGKTLFGAINSDIELPYVSNLTYEFGFVQSKYRV